LTFFYIGFILSVMGCLSSSEITAIKGKIADLDALIEAAEAAYLKSLTNSEIEEYRFDSGDGSQKTVRRSPKEIREEIEALLSRRGRLVRQLNGTSNINLTLRRKSYRRGRYSRGC
jgi:hypothetical protein